MTSYISFVVFSILLVTITIVVQSAPVEQINKILQSIVANNKKTRLESIHPLKSVSISPSSTTTVSIAHEENDAKQKLNIDDDDKIENTLHANIKETPAQIQSVDTDMSKVFTDIKMNPIELINIARQRRTVKLNDQSNQRRKRALSTYDIYNDDPLFESLFDQQQYIRPARNFEPTYWYPSVYERNIRSALASSLYDPSEWNRIYEDTDENDEDQIPSFNDDDDDDDESEYELNRYPVLMDSSNDPYNTDDLPIDDDQGRQIYFTRYGPIETYLK